MKKIRIHALIITAAILLSAFISSCSPAEIPVQTNINITESVSLIKIKNDLIENILGQAEIYKYFLADLKETSEISENLKAAIENAENLLYAGEISEDVIKNAVKQLEEAAEKFRIYYFEPENEKKPSDADLIEKLYIGEVKCAYDESSRTFYYTMGQQIENREFKFDFYIKSKLKSSVFAEIYDSDGNKTGYKFVPKLNKAYTLKSYSKSVRYDYKIIFTMLPIIQIDNINRIGDEYKDCTISVTDPDFSYGPYSGAVSHMFVESAAKIHIRGGISRGFPKKAYAIKFIDQNGNNKNIPLFDLRNDSDWILDAMYIDKARARNRISTDVWNDYNSRLYYMREDMKPQTNGTRGLFVEVFLKNEYMGLYCFTEKIDRKQLQLLKNDNSDGTVQSLIYKGKSWDEPLLFRKYWDYNNNSAWWGAFVQKFPNPSKGGKIEWKPLADFVNFGVNASDKDFAEKIGEYIDINNFVDYTIYLCITYAYDNTGKNCYWSVYDMTDAEMAKIFLTPWDMDASWGRSWNGDKIPSSKEWMDSEYEHDSFLFRRLVLTNAGGFADKVRLRWSALRDDVLSAESLIKRFDDVFDLFDKSGAWERESMRWSESELNLETERKYMREWTFERWNYIDDFIRNKLDTLK